MDTSLEGTIKFVQLIQKHPEIYDRNRKSLNPGPGALNAAWNDVVNQSGGSLQECKHRWRNLQCLYSKYLKNIVSQVNPHGIESYLSFLTPILRPSTEEGQPLEDRFDYNVKLVNHVRKRPCLYNGTEVNARPALWQEIAERLQEDYPDAWVTVERCQRRWTALRLAYNTYLRKGYQFRPWGIEDHLSFLTPHLHYNQLKRVDVFGSDKRLIDLVKIYPCLYDGTDHVNIEAWKEVADAMGETTTPQRCLHRWLELRQAFQRHLLNGSVMYPRGIEQLLAFLKPYVNVQEMLKIHRLHIPSRAIADYDVQDVQFVMDFAGSMKQMNDAQKRQFRVGAVRLTREILGE